MTQVGDKLPSTSLYEGSPTNKVNLAELFGDKKGVIFAVPGAFTPGCSKVQLLISFHLCGLAVNHSVHVTTGYRHRLAFSYCFNNFCWDH